MRLRRGMMPNTDEVAQAIKDSDWWQSICKLIGAGLIGFTYKYRATIKFPDDANCCELDGRSAEYIAKQVEEREDLLKLLKRCRKELRTQEKDLTELRKHVQDLRNDLSKAEGYNVSM